MTDTSQAAHGGGLPALCCWSAIRAVPLAFHIHALSSSTWLMLLIVQSLAIHRCAFALLWQGRQYGPATKVKLGGWA